MLKRTGTILRLENMSTILRSKSTQVVARIFLAGVSIAGLLYLLVLPLMDSTSNSTLLTFTLLFTSVGLAINWNLTGGFTGYVDFGHAVWFGIGAYVTAIMMSTQNIALSFRWHPVPAILLSMVMSGMLAALIGRITMRLHGAYFSIAMLGTFVAVREIVRVASQFTGGGVGLTLPPYQNRALFYYLELGLVLTLIMFTRWLLSTRFGVAMRAIREDEIGAATRGISTTRIKVAVFSFAGASTGLFGGLWAYQNTFVDPDVAFVELRTVDAILGALLGGLGTVVGPVIGSLGLYWLREVLWVNLLDYHLLAQGVILILVVLFLPTGIVGIFKGGIFKGNRTHAARISSIRITDLLMRRSSNKTRRHTRQPHPHAHNDTHHNSHPHQPRAHHNSHTHQNSHTHHNTRDCHTVLEGSGIVKRFGGLTAVDNVDIKVAAGETVGLIGPNGSGKTTLFNCLVKTSTPDSGTITVNGSDITRMKPHQVARIGVSRTFQVVRVYNHLTVLENMQLSTQWANYRLHDLFRKPDSDISMEHKLDELLRFLLLTETRDKLAATLSGGQRRLLEIAMALMSDPMLVLLDESTAGVNPSLIEDIKKRLVTINSRDNVALLLVEHNERFIADLCERVVVLDSGLKLTEGTPDQVMRSPEVIEAYYGTNITTQTRDINVTAHTREDTTQTQTRDIANFEQKNVLENMLEVTSLRAGYMPGEDVVKGIDLSVGTSEIVCVIGPNGSGKSTVFKALYGLVNVSAGKVLCDGVDITNLKPQEMLTTAGIAIVPQLRSTFSQMTVQENLELGMYRCRNKAKVRARVDYVYDLFPKLAERTNQMAGTMSGGEQRMLEIGRSLMWEPRMVLMDEPSAGLAPSVTGEVFDTIQRLNRETALTILMIEQNALQGLRVSHKGYVIEEGNVTYQGNAHELLSDTNIQQSFLGLGC